MTTFDSYVFSLCLVVFITLTLLFTVLITSIVRLNVKLIRQGGEDRKISAEYRKMNTSSYRALSKVGKTVSILITSILCVIFIAAFLLALYSSLNEDKPVGSIPQLKVVQSDSMSEKNEKNTYLFENGLDDQFNTFDLIITYELPAESELELYDVVVYQYEDQLIIHRIVGIEEPNEKHSERYFKLQGDAVPTPDGVTVKYEDMRAIYNGERIPYIGSFFSFMQSPAGYLCILLVVFAIIATPIAERIIAKEKRKRWDWYLY